MSRVAYVVDSGNSNKVLPQEAADITGRYFKVRIRIINCQKFTTAVDLVGQ